MKMSHIEFFRGDSKVINLTVKDQDGNPVDITGATITFTVKEDAADADDDAVIQVDGDPIPGSEGKAKIELEPTDTDVEPKTTYVFDIQIKIDSNVYTVAQGGVSVLRDITQDS